MSEQKRGSLNVVILSLFVCLNLIAPALVIVRGVARFGPFRHISWIQEIILQIYRICFARE